MDTQQLMPLSTTLAEAPASRGGTSAGGAGAFAAELAQAAAADKGPSVAAQGSRPGELAAFDGAALEALHQALPHDDFKGLEVRLDDASITPGDAQAVLEELKELLPLAGQDAAALLPAHAEGDEWSALRERLALIGQAGQLAGYATTEGASPAENVPAALTPLVESLTQGDGARPFDVLKGGAETAPRVSLQHAIQEAMLSTGQPQARLQSDGAPAPRLASAEVLSASLNRQPLATAAMTPSSPVEGSRETLLEGLSPLTGNLAANAQPGATFGPGAAQAATASLSAPVSSPAWPQQLGQQLVRMSQNGGEQRVELKLHPAELGPLSISLKLGDQGAQAQFLSAHGQVRQILEQSIPQLREALAEQGIELGETMVGEQQAGNGGHGDSHENDQSMLAGGGAVGSGGTGPESLAKGLSERAVNLDGRVDLYA